MNIKFIFSEGLISWLLMYILFLKRNQMHLNEDLQIEPKFPVKTLYLIC